MALKIDAKSEGRLACALENDKEFGKFSPEHIRKVQNWVFDGILLSKV